MEYVDHASYNTTFPFRNKHQSASAECLDVVCAFKKSKYSESHEIGKAN